MKKQKLAGEFVCFEVRDENNNTIGIDVFYNGIFQHRWMMVQTEIKQLENV